MKESIKECLVRAMRTFGQAAVGYIVANAAASLAGATETPMLRSALIGLCVSAVAAGLAALMNMPRSQKKHTEGSNG